MTPSGKIDRPALMAQPIDAVSSAYQAPSTQTEETLQQIWQALLNVSQVSVTDEFFALGGNSLLALQLLSQLETQLHVTLPLQTLLTHNTIQQLAQQVESCPTYTEKTSFVPLRVGNETETSFFIFHAVSGIVFPFATLLPYLSSTQPVYALQARGIYDDLPLFESLEKLAAQTIHEMKRIQLYGPYTIGGWSFGGMVAFEIARQLKEQGDDVAFLGIIDTYPQTSDPTIDEEILTTQEELQAFFYLLDDTMNVNYRCLDDKIFEQAANQDEPVDWLLDQVSEQGVPPAIDPAIVKRIWVTLERNSQLMQAYQPKSYDGNIALFCAEESAPQDGAQRWQTLTPQLVEAVWVSGEHNTMLNAENVERLGCELAMRLKTNGEGKRRF